ncbi:MAG TPA: alpha/beta hydrolase [Dehalococcoidia bacterium]|nr:alpha/beta hydrolase [Dehalococcoidia bacterium]
MPGAAGDQAFDEIWITAQGGLRFHARGAGSGRLVLLLHGFPQCWYCWRWQIPALAPRYRAVAPDLRGYNLSDKPAGGYDVDTLAGDVVALIRALGHDRAVVVGHDWGGAIAWVVALRYPEVVEALAILNAPHPAAYRRALRRYPRQLLRSWYVGFFQIPFLPEQLLTAFGGRLTAVLLRGSARRHTFTPADLAVYRAAITVPGAARAALAYYRALPRRLRSVDDWSRRIECPTLVLWGERDPALDLALLDELDRWVPNLTVRTFPGATHWIPEDAPDEVNRALLDWLA